MGDGVIGNTLGFGPRVSGSTPDPPATSVAQMPPILINGKS